MASLYQIGAPNTTRRDELITAIAALGMHRADAVAVALRKHLLKI